MSIDGLSIDGKWDGECSYIYLRETSSNHWIDLSYVAWKRFAKQTIQLFIRQIKLPVLCIHYHFLKQSGNMLDHIIHLIAATLIKSDNTVSFYFCEHYANKSKLSKERMFQRFVKKSKD